MKIDNINYTQLDNISFDYDNLELLKVVRYFLDKIVNDIEYINNEYFEDNERQEIEDFTFDLGCGYVIEQQDLESIVSIIDTINDIEKYNEEV